MEYIKLPYNVPQNNIKNQLKNNTQNNNQKENVRAFFFKKKTATDGTQRLSWVTHLEIAMEVHK